MLWMFFGCSDQGFSKTAEVDGVPNPAVEVSPVLLDFGDIGSGEEATADQTFIITSVGETDLDVMDILIEGDAIDSFTIVSENTSSMLPPGATMEVDVAFAPMGSGHLLAQAIVMSDDPENPRVPVDLIAEAVTPELLIDPDPIQVGDAYIGCENTVPVNIISVGGEPAHITSLNQTGSNFSLNHDLELPLDLPVGELVTVDVTLHAEAAQGYTGWLEVASNEPMGLRTAEEMGAGRYSDPRTDLWEVGDAKVDLMFYVDQSCSMRDDQAALAANFSSFINQLDDYASNWQVIVSNNDDGCNMGGILTPTTPNYEDRFSDAVADGGGSYSEAGLTIAANTIENTDPTECNAGFLREDALLHIIMVSDEREQSSGSWSTYVDAVRTKKGADSLVKMSAVAGDYPSGCGSAEYGSGYYEAAVETGGEFLSICGTWSSHVEALAGASAFQDTYVLSQDAHEETIVVRINGKRRDVGWTYDSAAKAVIFDATHVPEPGDEVTADYNPVVTCN